MKIIYLSKLVCTHLKLEEASVDYLLETDFTPDDLYAISKAPQLWMHQHEAANRGYLRLISAQ